MSSWVENQRQEAFILWRRYLALSLHFRDGSSFDYGLYGGVTNATLQSFLKRPPEEQAAFIKLKNRLVGINAEEFLFANHSNLHYRSLLSPSALKVYSEWKKQWGTPEAFDDSVKDILVGVVTPDRFQTLGELVIHLLGMNTPNVYEAIAWILQRNPEILTKVRMEAEENELYKIHLSRAIKVQKLYSYLCII